MFKERMAIKVMLPIFTVLTVFALMSANFYGFMKYMLLNADYWIDQLVSDYVIDAVYDDLIGELEYEISLPNDSDMDTDEFMRELFDKDFVKFFAKEIYEAGFTGDTDFDEDYLYDWIDDKEDLFEEAGLSKSEIKELKKELPGVIEDTLEESEEELKEEIEDVFSEIRETVGLQLDVYFYGSLIAIVVMLVVLLIVAKNKYLPIRNFGISLVCGEASCLAIVGLFDFIFQMALKEVEDFEDVVYHLLRSVFNSAYLVLGIGLVIGIVLLVVFAILSKKYVNAKNAEYAEEHVGEGMGYGNAANYGAYTYDPNVTYGNPYGNSNGGYSSNTPNDDWSRNE